MKTKLHNLFCKLKIIGSKCLSALEKPLRFLFICSYLFFAFNYFVDDSKTASAAANDTFSGVVVTLPSCPFVYNMSPTAYTTLSDAVLQVSVDNITIYLPDANGEFNTYSFSPDVEILNAFKTSQLAISGRYVNSGNSSAMYTSIAFYNTYCVLTLDNESYGSVEDTFRNADIHYIDVELSGSTLSYLFVNDYGDVIISVVFYGLRAPSLNVTYSCMYYDFATLDLQEAYDLWYDWGFIAGEDVGYEKGFRDGQDTNVPSPFEMIVDGVDRFFNITLFGDVKISTIFMIAFGSLMLGILLKVFLGG